MKKLRSHKCFDGDYVIKADLWEHECTYKIVMVITRNGEEMATITVSANALKMWNEVIVS
jgi:hypothetical protein